ncbi:hypothetical protein L1987_85312 [Smallanthus sonchifolius]|uniref:Uncharacterized protein n=2 Tax=Smallanthus sonchifolius TaxID=185202 RepID=A0ACB8XWU1_9ASTR|nr:hypothetical protein L1987_85310 [Smallanthus sonchifolius]KAI3675720.1 hypothetical protein L1987_85312 [Smallanthus sonchifolius]
MTCKPCYSEWESILPEPKQLVNCSTVIVRYTLSTPILSDSDHSSDLTSNEQECGQVRNKRCRSDLVGSSGKKMKVADTKNDVVSSPGGGGNVVFDCDLNNAVVIVEE